MGLLLDWAVQPLSAVLLLWLASLVMLAASVRRGRGRERGHGRRRRPGAIPSPALGANALAFAALWAAGTPAVANALVGALERRGEALAGDAAARCAADASLPIVVLGADMDAWSPDASPWRVLGPATLDRTLAAAELALASPGAPAYALGGGDNDRSLGELMARVLVERGVAPARVTAETRSRSTRDNARELARLLPPGDAPIRLVTSALHLARARGAFEAAGYAVCGAGVGSLVSPALGLPAVLPWTASLARTDAAAREALASLLYAWRAARTGDVPAPGPATGST